MLKEAWPVFWVALAVLTAAPSPFWAEWECPKGWTVPAGHCSVTAWRHNCSSWFLASIRQCPSTETPGTVQDSVQQSLGSDGRTESAVCGGCVQHPEQCVPGCAQKYNVPPWFPSGAGPVWDSPFKRQSKLLVSLDKPKEKKKIKNPLK